MAENKVLLNSGSMEDLAVEMEKIENKVTSRIDANPENVDSGLAKLVLTLIELLRKLMEKQAMRRLERGSLTDSEIEHLGETLMKLEDKMEELKGIFNLKDEDLNIDLGPLGNLM
ncbi:MAG: gas vesicle protein K [Marinifilaceae bacterium]